VSSFVDWFVLNWGLHRLEIPEESYRLLVAAEDPAGADTFPVHDARGDVERCRLVFLRLLTPPDPP
jgi:hypothetical protein